MHAYAMVGTMYEPGESWERGIQMKCLEMRQSISKSTPSPHVSKSVVVVVEVGVRIDDDDQGTHRASLNKIHRLITPLFSGRFVK